MWGHKKEKGYTTPVAPAVTASSTTDFGNDGNPYSKYGLSSPPRGSQSMSLEAALKRLKKDSRKLRRIVKNAQKEGATDDTKTKAKMIMFLYGRGFMLGNKKKERKKMVKEMIKDENGNSKRLLQVLEANGDNDLTHQPEYQDQYAYLRISLKRYFDRPNTFGFLPDMSNAKYYFRFQNHGNCFLQAPCVMAAYLAQKKNGIDGCAFPVDVSK
jgi:hypothetical protein